MKRTDSQFATETGPEGLGEAMRLVRERPQEFERSGGEGANPQRWNLEDLIYIDERSPDPTPELSLDPGDDPQQTGHATDQPPANPTNDAYITIAGQRVEKKAVYLSGIGIATVIMVLTVAAQ